MPTFGALPWTTEPKRMSGRGALFRAALLGLIGAIGWVKEYARHKRVEIGVERRKQGSGA